jgi:hypothetical protein
MGSRPAKPRHDRGCTDGLTLDLYVMSAVDIVATDPIPGICVVH